MRFTKLKPGQILTTKDFPVHNEQILKIYHKICKEGHPEILPPCPVVHKSLVDKRVKFEKAEYLLMDGSHKTTALTLTGNKINVFVLETDKDMQKAREMQDKGELISFSFYKTRKLREAITEMEEHHTKSDVFETVKEKTERMIKERVLPEYMMEQT